MNKILLYDATNSGHHFLYNLAVIESLSKIDKEIKITLIAPIYEYTQIEKLKKFKVNLINEKKYFTSKGNKVEKALKFFSLLSTIKKGRFDLIHFLYLDSEILNIYLFKLALRKTNLIGTLHWYPTNKKKLYMLEKLLNRNYINKIIVHGDFTKKKFESSNVYSLTYPNLHGFNEHSNISSSEKNLRILAFGGLRFDKGIDLLIQALKNVREDFELIIAGKEDYFTYENIQELITGSDIEKKVKLDLRFLSDEELDNFFNQCDIVVLPYRKQFTGQSGPLTEGVARKKIVLGPNHGEIGFTINNFKLGTTFESENIDDLASNISYLIQNYDSLKNSLLPHQEKYIKMMSRDTFVNTSKSIYNTIIQIDMEEDK